MELKVGRNYVINRQVPSACLQKKNAWPLPPIGTPVFLNRLELAEHVTGAALGEERGNMWAQILYDREDGVALSTWIPAINLAIKQIKRNLPDWF